MSFRGREGGSNVCRWPSGGVKGGSNVWRWPSGGGKGEVTPIYDLQASYLATPKVGFSRCFQHKHIPRVQGRPSARNLPMESDSMTSLPVYCLRCTMGHAEMREPGQRYILLLGSFCKTLSTYCIVLHGENCVASNHAQFQILPYPNIHHSSRRHRVIGQHQQTKVSDRSEFGDLYTFFAFIMLTSQNWGLLFTHFWPIQLFELNNAFWSRRISCEHLQDI